VSQTPEQRKANRHEKATVKYFANPDLGVKAMQLARHGRPDNGDVAIIIDGLPAISVECKALAKPTWADQVQAVEQSERQAATLQRLNGCGKTWAIANIQRQGDKQALPPGQGIIAMSTSTYREQVWTMAELAQRATRAEKANSWATARCAELEQELARRDQQIADLSRGVAESGATPSITLTQAPVSLPSETSN
jgi:hypothetical protein